MGNLDLRSYSYGKRHPKNSFFWPEIFFGGIFGTSTRVQIASYRAPRVITNRVRSEKMTRMVTSSCSPHVNPNTKQWCSHMCRRPAPRPVYSASSQAYYVSRTLMENELDVIWFAMVIEAAERWMKMDVHAVQTVQLHLWP